MQVPRAIGSRRLYPRALCAVGAASNRRGSVTVLTALMLVVLLGFAGVAVDGGLLYTEHQRMQVAADAAALAAAAALPGRPAEAEALARDVAERNGIAAADVTFTYPFQGDPSRVEVRVARTVPLAFARILGQNQANGTARAVARVAAPSAFDYAIFSASRNEKLKIEGGDHRVEGHVHGNATVEVAGEGHTITGRVEAVEDVRVSGSRHELGAVMPSSPHIPLPVFHADGLRSRATRKYSGNVRFQSHTTLDGILFVDGDVQISGNVEGVGAIVATGDITIEGHLRYGAAGSALALVAGGDIEVRGSDIVVDGILYAPNGAIDIEGARNTFNGALVALEVEIEGARTTVRYDSAATVAVPYPKPRLAE